jgi:hypothetical protein
MSESGLSKDGYSTARVNASQSVSRELRTVFGSDGSEMSCEEEDAVQALTENGHVDRVTTSTTVGSSSYRVEPD